MASARSLPLRTTWIQLTLACAGTASTSAFGLDLTNLINQATVLQNQAGQIQALIPGQNAGAAATAQQGSQGANQQAPNSNASLSVNPGSTSGQMQVITAIQMQWRADGCVFTQPQEISCQITVVNQGADRKLHQSLNGVSMIDSQGTEYRAKAGGFGRNESQSQVFANGVATVGVFRFRNVDPGTVAVKRLALNGQDPIVWSDVSLSRSGMSSTTTAGGMVGAPGALGGLLGQGAATKTATPTGKPTTLVAGAATTATAGVAPAPMLNSATLTQTGSAQPASQESRRAQHMAVRAAMAASAGRASH